VGEAHDPQLLQEVVEGLTPRALELQAQGIRDVLWSLAHLNLFDWKLLKELCAAGKVRAGRARGEGGGQVM
jgi:hypothetical protein